MTIEMLKETGSGAPVWVVDDDNAIRWVLNRALRRAGIACRTFDRAQGALDELSRAMAEKDALPSVLVSDIRMPGMSGVDLLAQAKSMLPDLPIIIMTAFSDLESAVSSFQGGAFEYLAKPFDVAKAVDLIGRAMQDAAHRQSERAKKADAAEPAGSEERRAADRIAAEAGSSVPDLIGQAPAMQDVFRAIGRLSQSSVTVLLTGESGAGKEVVARAIWKHSRRAKAPFIAINMAAIPKELLESELFGHEKGAFTGATATHYGRFEQAKGGTLFLDEIGDMPMELQTRLLRVLSSGSFYRVGGRRLIESDVRIIAATNQDLEARVREGLFREDLYHRLNVIRLKLPPLRERREDVGPLARRFLLSGAAELGVEPKTLSADAQKVIEAFPFPGNVRQLENLCRWLLVMAPSHEVCAEDLPQEYKDYWSKICREAPAGAARSNARSAAPFSFNEKPRPAEAHALPGSFEAAPLDWTAELEAEADSRLAAGETGFWHALSAAFERTLIRSAMHATKGRRIEAAERLGVGRNTLTRKIQELDMEDELERSAGKGSDGISVKGGLHA